MLLPGWRPKTPPPSFVLCSYNLLCIFTNQEQCLGSSHCNVRVYECMCADLYLAGCLSSGVEQWREETEYWSASAHILFIFWRLSGHWSASDRWHSRYYRPLPCLCINNCQAASPQGLSSLGLYRSCSGNIRSNRKRMFIIWFSSQVHSEVFVLLFLNSSYFRRKVVSQSTLSILRFE